MDGRFEARGEELLAQACVSVKDWEAVVAQLEAFVEPFIGSLTEAAQRRHFVEYSSGLLSSLERKTGEGIAYLHGHHHQTLSLIAAWFLNEETRREKIQTPAMTVPQARRLIAAQIEHRLQSNTPAHITATAQHWLQRNELARASRYETRNLLLPLKNRLRT